MTDVRTPRIGMGDSFGVAISERVLVFRTSRVTAKRSRKGWAVHCCANAVFQEGWPEQVIVLSPGVTVWLEGLTELILSSFQIESQLHLATAENTLDAPHLAEMLHRMGEPMPEKWMPTQACCLECVDPLQYSAQLEEERRHTTILRMHGEEESPS